MIEIRTFDGSPRELAEFCVSCWKKFYQGTDMPFALWSGEFMDWENFAPGHEDREFLVAAYDGTRLVGALPARPCSLTLHGQPATGTVASYFSIDPDYADSGVAVRLNLESRRRHRSREIDFMLGFVYLGANVAKGRKFWLTQPASVKVIRKVGLWARVLDHRAVAEFERSSFERWGARMLGLVQSAPKAPRDSGGVRPYRDDDLADCLVAARAVADRCQLSCAWNEQSLGRQLEFGGVPRTWVAEREGRVAGLVNYCRLDLRRIDAQGDSRLATGTIDLLALDGLSAALRARLLRTALHRMHAEGCQVALLLRSSCYPAGPLLRQGFVPQPAAYLFTLTEMGRRPVPPGLRKLQVHWR